MIEIVSPGNKHTEHALDQLLETMTDLFAADVPLLIVDLFPPSKHDPEGLHAAFWGRRRTDCPGATDEKPFTLAAYHAAESPTAYFEPAGLGQPLTDMPAFLDPWRYVNVPLGATYQRAWQGILAKWRRVLEAPHTP